MAAVGSSFAVDTWTTSVGPVSAPSAVACTIGFWKNRDAGKWGLRKFFAGGANTAPESPEVAEQSLFFVSGHEFPVAYISLIRPVEGRVTPARVALLASFASDNRVTREDKDTLVIEPEHGFLAAPADRLERRLEVPFQKGDRVRMPDFEAEVRQVTENGRPQIVAFHFQKPLEDPAYRWLSWNLHGAVSFDLPAVGEQVVVPSPPLESLFPSDEWAEAGTTIPRRAASGFARGHFPTGR